MAKHNPNLDRLLNALADPTRRGMLETLTSGEATVGDLARPTGFALPTILRHLSVLQDAGLIETDKQGRQRLCRPRPQALAPLTLWLQDQRDLWEGRLDRLEAYVQLLMKEKPMIPELDPTTDLHFTRTLAAPRSLIWDCWTMERHIPHFFVPKPHKVTSAQIDLRVGGRFNTTFDVDGNIMDNKGVYLEVISGEKLVFTDTYTEGWKPAPEPFMTAILLFSDAPGGGTTYTAIARHRNAETANTHKDMGFYGGWGTVVDQLEEYAKGLRA